jgi:hypothetical protein
VVTDVIMRFVSQLAQALAAILEPMSQGLFKAVDGVAQALAYLLNPAAARNMFQARPKVTDEALETRLDELAHSMQVSSALVVEVEAALRARQAAAERLRGEAETAQRIMDLTQAERDAVAAVLRAEVAREGKKTLWQGAAVNGVFFLLGIVATVVLDKLT